jgi:voltage-gated potassium channel
MRSADQTRRYAAEEAPGMTTGETRLSDWERRLEWPLTALAVIFLGLYAFEVLDTGLSGSAREAVDLGLTAIWVLFGTDYVHRRRRRLRAE